MNIEQQVVSIDLARRLEELGVKQDSYFYWTICDDCTKATGVEEATLQDGKNHGNNYSAFTVAELGEILPKEISYEGFAHYLVCETSGTGWHIYYRQHEDNKFIPACRTDEEETNARAKMLIYLIENGLMEVPK